MQPITKAVLAYSGGLDTSIIVPWLRENYHCEVVCFCADLGQAEELEGLEEKALRSGASKLITRDLQEEFLTDFVFPTLQSGAVYERVYLLGTSFARPLIGKHLVEIAEAEGADAIAHGCTGKGNAQPKAADHRPVARVGHPQPRRRYRLRRSAQCPDHLDAQKHLQPRPQHLSYQPRGRPAREPLERAGRVDVRAEPQPGNRA